MTIHEDQIAAGKAVRYCLAHLAHNIRPGMSTKDISIVATKLLQLKGAEPAVRGYRGFPEDTCVSLNHEACHGIPLDDVLIKDTDVVKVDVVARVGEWHADACMTYPMSNDPEHLEMTMKAMSMTSAVVKKLAPGVHISQVSKWIELAARSYDVRLIREFFGHGIGKQIHQDPMIPSFYDSNKNTYILKEGDVITIEPIITKGSGVIVFDTTNDWTNRTRDGEYCYQVEHTVAITDTGHRILT